MHPPSDFEQEQALFTRCLDHPPEEWDAVLAAHCDDDALRERVRRLLERHGNTHVQDAGFLRLDGRDPDRIGPYRILRRLGEGGMGIVYAAEQREPVRRRVAVKVLRAGYSSHEVLVRFDIERQALALMSHPSIARILDAGTTADHRPFIVMEFVPGETITRYCEQRELPLKERLLLFCDVCDAVQHAHQRGVIHRDLKPSNILIMEDDGRALPKIIDFGIAKATTARLTDQTHETQIGSLLGTPDYMSPEQAELSPLDIDTRADVYALGAVLYEILTGVPPLQISGSGKSYAEIQNVIQEKVPSNPSSRVEGALRRQVRGELDWITLKALEKQRARRYASPAELATDIRHHLANETVIAGPPSRVRRVAKFARRHWISVGSAAVVGLTLAASVVLLLEKNRELQLERDRANTEAATSENVTAFLLDIFRASNPSNADGGKTTARDLLERGRKKIANDAALPDEVRLQLTLSLAKAYGNLWLVMDALELYEQSHALYVSSNADDPLVEFEILLGLGHWLDAAQRSTEAREPFEAALQLAEGNPDIPYERVVGVHIAVSHADMQFGDFAAAQARAETLFAETRARFGIEDRSTLRAGGHLAAMYSITADFDAAERLIQELAPAAERTMGEDSTYTSAIQHILGILYIALERWDDAERTLRPVYNRYLERLGPDAIAMQSLALQYALTLPDDDAALRMLERMLARQRMQYGEDAPILVDTLQNIGVIHLRIPGHEPQAEQFLEQARVLSEKTSGAGHLATRSIYYELARLHARTGRLESAMEFLRRTGDVPVYQFGAAHSPDFDALRENPEFVTLLGKFGDGS